MWFNDSLTTSYSLTKHNYSLTKFNYYRTKLNRRYHIFFAFSLMFRISRQECMSLLNPFQPTLISESRSGAKWSGAPFRHLKGDFGAKLCFYIIYGLIIYTLIIYTLIIYTLIIYTLIIYTLIIYTLNYNLSDYI